MLLICLNKQMWFGKSHESNLRSRPNESFWLSMVFSGSNSEFSAVIVLARFCVQKRHGGPNDTIRHVGDLGNVVANGTGTGFPFILARSAVITFIVRSGEEYGSVQTEPKKICSFMNKEFKKILFLRQDRKCKMKSTLQLLLHFYTYSLLDKQTQNSKPFLTLKLCALLAFL